MTLLIVREMGNNRLGGRIENISGIGSMQYEKLTRERKEMQALVG